MTQDAFLRILERTLQCPAGSARPAVPLEELGWDSMGELGFIAVADRELGQKVEPAKVADCKTVGDLLALLDPALDP